MRQDDAGTKWTRRKYSLMLDPHGNGILDQILSVKATSRPMTRSGSDPEGISGGSRKHSRHLDPDLA